jgi:hypothetical protein
MPGKPRAGRLVQRREFDTTHLCQLVSGHKYFHDSGFVDDDDLRHGWEQLREPVLDYHISTCPGSRPFCWWKFDAPEPRIVLYGVESRESGFAPWRFLPGLDVATIQAEWPAVFARLWAEHEAGNSQRAYWYGVPVPWAFPHDAVYESQARYLRRLHLLTAAEHEVPSDLDDCDAWFAERYDDDPPHPKEDMGLLLHRLLGH